MYLYMHISPNGKKYVGITCQKPEGRWRKGEGYKKMNIFIEQFKNTDGIIFSI